jgi:hypothetical protein
MSSDAYHRGASQTQEAAYRYGIVLLLVLALVILEILMPESDTHRALVLALEAGALLVTVATSRARREVRRERAVAVSVAAVLVVIAVGTGLIPRPATFLLSALLALAIPVALVGGLLRLTRDHGVTVPAVAGALAIYVLVGLVFANLISFAEEVDDGPYFTQGPGVSSGERVYFSFITMSTTGFGDFTPATSGGRTIAVVEMLIGQIYLVTVIGILVGHLARPD